MLKTAKFPVLFEGFINSKQQFLAGCKHEGLKQKVESSNINFEEPSQVKEFIVNELNILQSQFGGTAEGFVIKHEDGKILAKVNKPDQARGEAAREKRDSQKCC